MKSIVWMVEVNRGDGWMTIEAVYWTKKEAREVWAGERIRLIKYERSKP